MKSEKVLITGGAGYIGSVVAGDLLEKGHKVACLDNLSFGPQSLMHLISNPDFEFIFGDVRNEGTLKELVPKYDVIIPLAAVVGAPQCDINPVDAELVNRDAIIIIDKLRSKNQKILYPNTNSGYGTTTGEVFCTEDTSLNPISKYGQTKCEAERALLDSGKGAVTFRLATAFGMSPRMRTDLLLNNFVFHAVADGYLVVYEKDFKRNFIHVKDISACFEHGIENYDKMSGRPYNLGLDSANVSKQELVDKIKVHVPKLDVTYKEIGHDVDKRNYIVSNQRLRDAGFEGTHDLDHGIAELVRGYNLMFAKEVFRQ